MMMGSRHLTRTKTVFDTATKWLARKFLSSFGLNPEKIDRLSAPSLGSNEPVAASQGHAEGFG